jgi:hypothetical protein
VPPPPQTVGDAQVGHVIVPPHPLAIGPHALAGHVVIGTHGAPPGPPSAVTVPPPHTFD